MLHKDEDMYEGMIIAGFGGQGIVLAGKLLAQTAMRVGLEVTYIPAYGAEVRGGTSNCRIIISNRPIASPLVSTPDVLIIMNKASLTKFRPCLRPGGMMLYNSSLIEGEPQAKDSDIIVPIPADELAIGLGSQQAANMVMLGAYLCLHPVFAVGAVISALPSVLAQRHHDTLSTNIAALKKGADFVVCQG